MLWIKTFHIFFMVAWFAGIFYLPRLFVNLAMTQNDDTYTQLSIMARKLYRFTLPFMILTIAFGAWLVSYNLDYYLSAGWFHAKMGIIMILVAYQFVCGAFLKQFVEKRCHKGHVFFRWFNEVPVLFLLGAVLLAVIKPF